MTRTILRPTAAALLAMGLVACGGSTTTSPGAAPAAPSGVATPPSPDSASDEDANAAAAGTDVAKKVSANTASEDQIADAPTAAGVSSPGWWAEEVVEYRPYPADDPGLAKLRQNLAKYNPGQETTDKIVSALTP